MAGKPKPDLTEDENPEWTIADFAKAKTLSEVLPDLAATVEIARKRGRPKVAAPKQVVSLRLDPDVVQAFKATGDGWQTRINELLRKHKPVCEAKKQA